MPENLPLPDTLELVVLIPVYNDWEAVALLIKNIDAAAENFAINRLSIVLVDDASAHSMPGSFIPSTLKHIGAIRIIRLTRNLGHQRAIAVGLAYLHQHDCSDITIIMDGDGEDNPADIEKLIRASVAGGLQKIVFAERTIRSEGALFYLFYQLYRTIHRLLTGCKIRFGNFSAVPRKCLNSLVTVSELWNHYAASVVSSKIPYTLVQTTREKRYSGQSKMNFIGLVTHGLSAAIAVQREIVGTRILLLTTIGAVISFFVLCSAMFTTGTKPHGLPLLLLGICIAIALLVQMLSIMLNLIFMVLGNRDNLTFLPVRDCVYFIERVDCHQINDNNHDS